MLPVCVQTIFVPDLQEAVRFHTQAFGYEVKATYGPCIVQLKTGSTTLILQQLEAGKPPSTPTTVLSFQTDDIQAAMRRVVEAGGELLDDAPQRCPVGVAAMVQDKAGVVYNQLQFDPGHSA